jgi:hypothetical protein
MILRFRQDLKLLYNQGEHLNILLHVPSYSQNLSLRTLLYLIFLALNTQILLPKLL